MYIVWYRMEDLIDRIGRTGVEPGFSLLAVYRVYSRLPSFSGRERDRHTDEDRECDREREAEGDKPTGTENATDTETKRGRFCLNVKRQRERKRGRERGRQRERQTEREI